MFIQLKLIKEKRKQSYQEKEAEMIERINQADPLNECWNEASQSNCELKM